MKNVVVEFMISGMEWRICCQYQGSCLDLTRKIFPQFSEYTVMGLIKVKQILALSFLLERLQVPTFCTYDRTVEQFKVCVGVCAHWLMQYCEEAVAQVL